jgi:hypothetical protein
MLETLFVGHYARQRRPMPVGRFRYSHRSDQAEAVSHGVEGHHGLRFRRPIRKSRGAGRTMGAGSSGRPRFPPLPHHSALIVLQIPRPCRPGRKLPKVSQQGLTSLQFMCILMASNPRRERVGRKGGVVGVRAVVPSREKSATAMDKMRLRRSTCARKACRIRGWDSSARISSCGASILIELM